MSDHVLGVSIFPLFSPIFLLDFETVLTVCDFVFGRGLSSLVHSWLFLILNFMHKNIDKINNKITELRNEI
jgi:hypothetical protein